MIPQKPEQSVTKFAPSGGNNVIVENYLENVKHNDDRIDFHSVYNSKLFDFRNNNKLCRNIR